MGRPPRYISPCMCLSLRKISASKVLEESPVELVFECRLIVLSLIVAKTNALVFVKYTQCAETCNVFLTMKWKSSKITKYYLEQVLE